MAKQQTFADKAAKAALQPGKKCPKCGAIRQSILYVTSEPSKGGSVKFNHRRIQLCQCNEKEYYS